MTEMIPGKRTAANAASITESDVQARRQRRQRRTGQSGLRNISGWVRAG